MVQMELGFSYLARSINNIIIVVSHNNNILLVSGFQRVFI